MRCTVAVSRVIGRTTPVRTSSTPAPVDSVRAMAAAASTAQRICRAAAAARSVEASTATSSRSMKVSVISDAARSFGRAELRKAMSASSERPCRTKPRMASRSASTAACRSGKSRIRDRSSFAVMSISRPTRSRMSSARSTARASSVGSRSRAKLRTSRWTARLSARISDAWIILWWARMAASSALAARCSKSRVTATTPASAAAKPNRGASSLGASFTAGFQGREPNSAGVRRSGCRPMNVRTRPEHSHARPRSGGAVLRTWHGAGERFLPRWIRRRWAGWSASALHSRPRACSWR